MALCCQPGRLPGNCVELIDTQDFDQQITIAVQTETACSKCFTANPQFAKFCCRCGALIANSSNTSMPMVSLPLTQGRQRGRKILEESEPPPEPDQPDQAHPASASQMLELHDAEVHQDAHLTTHGTVDIVQTEVPVEAPSVDSNLPFCEIVFWFKGDLFPVNFTRRPIGMKWVQKPPVKIDEVTEGSHADELGVKKGWVIKSVEGNDCSGKNYKFTTQALTKAFDQLPWVGASREKGNGGASQEKEKENGRASVASQGSQLS